MNKKRTEEWEQLVAEHARSGRSAMQFCRERGISDNRLYYWRKRLGVGGAAGQFVKVNGPDRAVIELELEGGVKIRFAVEHVKAVVDAVLTE